MLIRDSPEQMLQAAYRDLGYADDQNLVVAAESPSEGTSADKWVEQGEWLATAKVANAESVFFVDGNPVVVFAKHTDSNPSALRQIINRIWCMARPRLLFLASPGELRVFDLGEPPIRFSEESGFLHGSRVIKHAKNIRDVQQKLQKYSLEQVESGKLFGEKRFQRASNRADEALIKDLRTLRARLMGIPADSSGSKFELKHAHALIGRSIFIRYLEDRGVLLPEHFEEIAAKHPDWPHVLSEPYAKTNIEPEMDKKLYPRVLADKEFTYALFDWLADEFNGDMFPRDPAERQAVTQEHLDLLRGFLLGDVQDQTTLFFYAYNFEVIPIELISSIYEEFYTTEVGQKADQGTHYTPSALVEFVLSKVLTPAKLADDPRVLDPACGSGIFLVEAFRRIVRYRVWHQNGVQLGPDELRGILRKQIAGIEINPEAVRVAAFSLYLALLHYQHPSSIRAHKRLPNLIYDKDQPADREKRYDILLCANAFGLDKDSEARAALGASSADVVVGNPPWGFPKKREGQDEESFRKALAAANMAIKWCEDKERNLAVGYKELSQAFIHRAIGFLKDGGTAGLLVSSGVLFKSGKQTQKFREQWLTMTRLEHVVNFVHVKDVFFKNANAPFISVVFTKQTRQEIAPFEYWSAKKTAMTARLRAPILSRVDLQLLSQDEVRPWHAMWKIHWWGSHHDEALIRKLMLEKPLEELEVSGKHVVVDSGRGYQDCPDGEQKLSGDLRKYPELQTEDMEPYGPLNLSKPSRVRDTVHRTGKLDKHGAPTLYDGIRLLFRRGVSGEIVARLSFEPFCFRNSIHAFRIADGLEQETKVILAVCWSSLLRYYLFLTASYWGTWHDELQLEEVRKLPIRLPTDIILRDRIVGLVDELLGIDTFMNSNRIAELESAVDEAVFDLYELTEAERDLVHDMTTTGLDLFYKHTESEAVKPVGVPSRKYGVLADLPSQREASVTLSGYLHAFLKIWNRELEPDGEFRWQVIYPTANSPMVGVVFSTQYKNNPLPPPEKSHVTEWRQILRDLGESAIQPYGTRGVLTDGLVRSVSPTEIIIIKRNEQRLWTRSMAREDAEATLLQAMHRQETAEDAPLGST